MKAIKIDQLKNTDLLTHKEPLSIEYDDKTVGYYYPKIDNEKLKKIKEELDNIMEKVLAETGLTEEEYIAIFMEDIEK